MIFDQLLDYFTNNNLLCLDQFGFRPGHSTDLAALRLVDQLITQMDSCRVLTNIYIDLSKAFDTESWYPITKVKILWHNRKFN